MFQARSPMRSPAGSSRGPPERSERSSMSDVVGYRVAIQEQRAAALQDRVQQLLAPFDGTERALDSGCGAGALAFALAPFVESVVGVDLSAELVAAGQRARAGELRADRRRRRRRCRSSTARSTSRAACASSTTRARPELVVSELARVTRARRQDPARRPARLRRPGRLRRDRPLREGARPVARAAAARPGHPLPPRRQRPRGADERDRARASATSSATSISSGSKARSGGASAGWRPAPSTRSRSAGTSRGSAAGYDSVRAGEVSASPPG